VPAAETDEEHYADEESGWQPKVQVQRKTTLTLTLPRHSDRAQARAAVVADGRAMAAAEQGLGSR